MRNVTFADEQWTPNGPSLKLRKGSVGGPFKFLNPTTALYDIRSNNRPGGRREDLAEITDEEGQERAKVRWNARDYRKGRYILVLPRHSPMARKLRTEGNPHSVWRGIVRMLTVFPYWDVSWLIGVFFTVGCLIFVACGLFYWLPIAFPSTEFPGEAKYYGGITCFVGATLFQIGAFLLFFESYNDRAETQFGSAVEHLFVDKLRLMRRSKSHKTRHFDADHCPDKFKTNEMREELAEKEKLRGSDTDERSDGEKPKGDDKVEDGEDKLEKGEEKVGADKVAFDAPDWNKTNWNKTDSDKADDKPDSDKAELEKDSNVPDSDEKEAAKPTSSPETTEASPDSQQSSSNVNQQSTANAEPVSTPQDNDTRSISSASSTRSNLTPVATRATQPDTDTEFDDEPEVGESNVFSTRQWKWFPSWYDVRTHYIYEIGFLASFTMSLGATIFYIDGFLALPGINEHLSLAARQGGYYFPYLLGGILFALSSALYILENQPNWYTPAFERIGWHVGVWNLIGGIGWTYAASTGYCNPSWCEYQSELALVWASAAFSTGSALQWYESLDKYVIVVED